MKLDKWFYLRIFIIILALIQCPLLMGLEGIKESLSSYWNTQFQPLFLLINFTTCYFLISIPKWRFQSICLLLLTIFPVFNFPTVHNLMALSFFLSSFYPLSTDSRFSFYSIPYLFAIPLALHSLLYGEILAITILCCYHANVLCYKQYLLNKHDILN